jgi:hypothetical protein
MTTRFAVRTLEQARSDPHLLHPQHNCCLAMLVMGLRIEQDTFVPCAVKRSPKPSDSRFVVHPWQIKRVPDTAVAYWLYASSRHLCGICALQTAYSLRLRMPGRKAVDSVVVCCAVLMAGHLIGGRSRMHA